MYDIYITNRCVYIKQIHLTIKWCVAINHKNVIKCMTINISKNKFLGKTINVELHKKPCARHNLINYKKISKYTRRNKVNDL